MTPEDFPRILHWLAQPHVKEWWDDGDDTLEKVAAHYGDPSPTEPSFILLYHGKTGSEQPQPIGYMQAEIDENGVASIDQFIGEVSLLNRGLGTEAIKLLLDYRIPQHHPRAITVDPSPANKRAIRCYEKAGFRHTETIRVPTGEEAYMMQIDLPARE
jgi:RimJ/RimL family protein N-acetyltransferase